MKLLDFLKLTEEKSDTERLFDQTATAQRGAPESIMVDLQRLLGGGVFSFAIEHVGDITHRMSEHFDFMRGSYGTVTNKIEKTLHTLEHSYGFEREMKENLMSSFTYGHDKDVSEYDSYEDFLSAVRKLSKEYANAHRKIPVFNEPQRRARAAAIALGEWDFNAARNNLRWLLALTADKNKYMDAVSKVDIGEQKRDKNLNESDEAKAFTHGLLQKYKENGLRELDIRIDPRYDDFSVANIESILIDKSAQGSGIGTMVMKDITEWADNNNILLTLSLGEKDKERGTTSKSRLTRFYRRFGFVPNKSRNKLYELSMYASMYRKPKSQHFEHRNDNLMNEDSKQDILVSKFAGYIYELIKKAISDGVIPWSNGPIRLGEDSTSFLKGTLETVFQYAGIRSETDFEVPPPRWVTFNDMKDLIFYIIPEQPDNDEGKVTGGGFGRNKRNFPVIVISGLLSENPKKHVKTRLSSMRTTIVHELTHYMDDLRSEDIGSSSAEKYNTGDVEGYYGHPHEFNAYFQEAVDSIVRLLSGHAVSEEIRAKIRSKVLGSGFDAFTRYFLSGMPKAYKEIFNKYQRKLVKRIYKLYVELVDQYEITEGHDNATFLHPDIEPQHKFPLPTDAKKYKNVKSKRRGGAKVKVKTDSNSFEKVR